MDSQIMNVDSEDHVEEVQGKEKLNLHREGKFSLFSSKTFCMETALIWNQFTTNYGTIGTSVQNFGHTYFSLDCTRHSIHVSTLTIVA